ncbi:MAG TPA: hypothetical protein VH092_09655, partial [Urbifossiella sp.]|nr:hypothetical protein [Urbifossiella sp.]
DGKLLYSVIPDHTIQVWDVATGAAVRTFGAGKSKPQAVAVSADGKRLATFAAAAPAAGPDWMRVPEAVRVWDPATSTLVRAIPWPAEAGGESNDAVGFVGFDGGRVWGAAASLTGIRFRVWDAATGKRERDWFAPTPGRRAEAVALAPGAGRFAAAFQGGAIQLFDGETGKDLTPGGGHRGEVTDLRLTPDGTELVTVSDDRTVRTWEVGTGKERAVRDGVAQFARLSADGSAVYNPRYRRVPPDKDAWDLVATDRATGRALWEFPGPLVVTPAPDGKTVWANRPDTKDVAVLDAATGKMLRPVGLPGVPVGFGDAGRLAVCGGDGKTVSGWDVETGQKRFGWNAKTVGLLRSGTFQSGDQEREYVDSMDAMAVSPDGRFVAVVVHRHLLIEDEQSSLYVCDAATGKEVWRVKSDYHFSRSVAFSPDGRRVAVGGWKARVFDAATGAEATVLDGHRGYVNVVTFSRDGRRLATGGSDGTAVVWDLARK